MKLGVKIILEPEENHLKMQIDRDWLNILR